MLKNWAIYRYEGEGKLRYLGVVSASGQDDALAKAIKLLPEEDRKSLRVKRWMGEPERGTA